MEYTSFYGGRRGESFVIVKSYPSIAEMVAAFSQGGAYTVVNYDEYVIIDTVDKNDIDNGKIYRRGYEYNNKVGGAVYIGQIVGPSGMAPHVEMKTIKEVEDIYDGRGPVDSEGNEYRKTEGEYAPTENLIPGEWVENGEQKYHDSIQWVACSVRDAHSHESTVHIGFIIPYLVVDYTAKSVDPYYHRSNETDKFDNERLIYRDDDGQHPFYEKWNISIPKGIKGDSFKNFRVTTVAECNEQHPGWLQEYAGMEDDEITEAIKKERKILVYDYYHFDKEAEGEPVSIYLGDYNEITNVDLADDGTLTIDYTHEDEDVWVKAFKWIKSVSLNVENGHFEVIYNHDQDKDGVDTKYTADLTWVKDIAFAKNGSVTLTYTNLDDKTFDRLIKWVTETTLDPDTGRFTVKYNHDTDVNGEPTIYEQDLRWVKEVTIDDKGTITFDYTNGPDTVYKNMFKWVKSTSLNPETGHFEVLYNYDEDGEGQPTKYEADLRWVKSITLDDDGTLFFDYTYGNDETYNKKIKWIRDVELDGVTGHLRVRYNHTYDANGDLTTYETDLRYVNHIDLADNGNVTLKYTVGEDVLLDNHIRWIDETILDEEGTMIIKYNDGTVNTFEWWVQWIQSITFTDEGLFTIHYNNGQPDLVKEILWPIKIEVDTGEQEGQGTQAVKVTYNNGRVDTVSEPINYIMETAIDTRYHLLVYYADPSRRAWIKNNGKNATWDGKDDWYDLGYIGYGTGPTAVMGKVDDEGVASVAATLPPYSVWVVTEEK